MNWFLIYEEPDEESIRPLPKGKRGPWRLQYIGNITEGNIKTHNKDILSSIPEGEN
jgi:hypothetical protein